MNRDEALQAAELVEQGNSVRAIAQSWGITPATIYSALKRYGIEPDRPASITPSEHIELQRQSGLPPEVYAYRAGIRAPSLRRYAWNAGEKLAMNLHTEKKAWWERELDAFSPENAQAFCALRDVPVPMVAHWYHLINRPPALLLWGFNRLLRVKGDQFQDFQRFNDPEAELFALGQGKLAVPISVRLADEIFRHAQPYQQS